MAFPLRTPRHRLRNRWLRVFAWRKTTEGGGFMAKFMCTHTVPAKSMNRDRLTQFTDAAQKDPVIKGYRSFTNLSEGRIVCVLEAPTKEDVAKWFQKMNMP